MNCMFARAFVATSVLVTLTADPAVAHHTSQSATSTGVAAPVLLVVSAVLMISAITAARTLFTMIRGNSHPAA